MNKLPVIAARAVMLALGFALLVGACSSGGSNKAGSVPASSKTTTTTTVAAPTTTAKGGGAGPTKAGYVPGLKTPALASLRGFSCTADQIGRWSAQGELQNDLAKPQKFNVQINVVDTKSSTVKGSVSKDFLVAAKEKSKLDVTDFYTGKPAGLTCTVHVTRASV